MSEVETARDTVAVDEKVHRFYKELTEGSDPVSAPFRTMKDVFMWAACLGHRSGERKELSGKRVTIFRWAQLSPQIDIPLLKAFALTDDSGVEALASQDTLLMIAEEYANAGIRKLALTATGSPSTPLWNLIDALLQEPPTVYGDQ